MWDQIGAEEGQCQRGMTFTLSHSRNAQTDRLLRSTHVMSGMKYLELCCRPESTDVTFLQRHSL